MSTTLQDGTSQGDRALPALDPQSVKIDERTTGDLLAFVQALSKRIDYIEHDPEAGTLRSAGTWEAFATSDSITVADVLAYIADPASVDRARARWLGRPHYALLLTFLELLSDARVQLNRLTERHLDYYYLDILGMRALPAEPDHAAVVFRLANRVSQLRLPAGTALQAGRDVRGVPRIYRTERELNVNRTRVEQLRSVFVQRQVITIASVHTDRSLTVRQVLEAKLRLALTGALNIETVIARLFSAEVATTLRFGRSVLQLEHHELRALLKRVRRRAFDDRDWNEINRLMGAPEQEQPRAFLANIERVLGKQLDFTRDGLSQVNDIDDLHEHRADPAVRNYIETELRGIGFENFEKLMAIKRAVDAEWGEINRLLQLMGRRRRDDATWRLDPADATAFQENFVKALSVAGAELTWPAEIDSLETYHAWLREREEELGLPVERIDELLGLVSRATMNDASSWSRIDSLLSDAHCERAYAARRAELKQTGRGLSPMARFDAIAARALGQEPSTGWVEAMASIRRLLDPAQCNWLRAFRTQLAAEGGGFWRYDWSDAYRLFELVQRKAAALADPVASRTEWRNLYPAADAASQLVDASGSPRWRTFGQNPGGADRDRAPKTELGWAIRSPLLSLSEGGRAITVCMNLEPASFDGEAFLRAVGGSAFSRDLVPALNRVLRVEITTAKSWLAVAVDDAGVLVDQASLWFTLVIAAEQDAIAPLASSSDGTPTLRVLLRPQWDERAREWTLPYPAFAPLVLRRVSLEVSVTDLTSLKIQVEDRPVDSKKSFEPFGSAPWVGARMFLSHPELTRGSLRGLRFAIEWDELPDFAQHYRNYPGERNQRETYRFAVVARDRRLEHALGEYELFREQDSQSVALPAQPIFSGQLQELSSPGGGADIRNEPRCFYWKLLAPDLGHALYPSLTTKLARSFAVALAQGQIDENDPDKSSARYQVEAPYTPKLGKLSASYLAKVWLDDAALWHVHPFGMSALPSEDRRLLPRYEHEGELYIGLSGVEAPQNVTLLFQLAEGSSDPDIEPVALQWSCLDGERFVEVRVRHDSTDGLINTGIVELALPAARPGTRLPADLYWLRVAVPARTRAACDSLAIRAQAVMVRFDDRGNAPEHYQQPLPVGSIDRLVELDARIAAVEQPASSVGARSVEAPEQLRTRVSERLRHKQRALSPWDYERLVLQHFTQIYKAKCLPAGVVEPGVIHVLVIPDIRNSHPSDVLSPTAPANLLAEIKRWLTEHTPAAANVRVRNPVYVPVTVRLAVRFTDASDIGAARKLLNADLIRFLSPWAYDEGADVAIGGSIHANSILEYVDRLGYVDYVSDLKLFTRPGRGAIDYVSTEQPDQVLVAAHTHHIDGSNPGRGIGYMKMDVDFVVKDPEL